MAFVKNGTLGEKGGPLLVERVITNSVTVAIGDAVVTTSGFAALATTGAKLLGFVESVNSADGLNPKKDGTFLANPDSSFAAASDNQTVAMVSVRADVSKRSLYLAAGDAAYGTTTGSNLAGKTFDLADEDQVDESTVNTTSQQVYSHGLDRLKTTLAVVNIFESEVFGL